MSFHVFRPIWKQVELTTRPLKKRRLLSSDSYTAAPRAPYRILLFGADEFSCATLSAIHDAREDLVEELVVVTPPDARTGRGLKTIHRPPLREMAESLNLASIALPPTTLLKAYKPPTSFLDPTSSTPSLLDPSRTLLLTASFGHLIPTTLLSLFPPLNTLNVHPSLLPKYRGAAPIQWAIVHGEQSTGVSVQELSRGKFDQGRLLGQKHVSMPPLADFKTLEPILAREGANLLVEVLRNLEKAQANAVAQTGVVSHASKIVRDHARIVWDRMGSDELKRLQRGIGHQFPLWTTLKAFPSNPNERSQPPKTIQLQLLDNPAFSVPDSVPIAELTSLPPGSTAFDPRTKTLFVRCAAGVVGVEKVKGAGGKWVGSGEWWNGVGRKLGTMRME
ncbi:BQ5605_C001g00200 [Microbotryum silenes-dioicae]|uniref:methionyl-tRNA formyltransferase n=1 Tax=Microbotryum silenes-dioicae TaxID=796604 RepID=A0A2X0M2K9_9BASI|nr:BQ5605_C001g00200 [Microbotryum silenes-dioicae]